MSQSVKPIRVVMVTIGTGFVGLFENMLRERGHKLVGLVTAPGPRIRRTEGYREVAKLARPGLDVIVSNYPSRWADMIRPLKPDVIFCGGFNWKLPADVLDVPPLGAFNTHDGFLPNYRGRNATGWALRTGAPGWGVSVHRMTPELDDGPILSQREIVIGDDEDGDDLLPRFVAAVHDCTIEAYDLVVAGFPGTPQDESQATYAGGAFEPEWREIDWNKPARDVFFQIRSWHGHRDVPLGAYGDVEGKRLLITKAKPVYGPTETSGASPGTVLSHDNGEILVQCADGPLRIMKWEEIPLGAGV